MNVEELPNFKLSKTNKNLLLLFGLLLILIAVPFTVYLSITTKELVQKPKAATAPLTPCSTNCGDPRFFCDSWPPPESVSVGPGFCDDYRDLYRPTLNFLTDCPFPGTVRNDVSANYLSSTDPDYTTHSDGILLPGGFFFNQQEHIHTQVKDGNFGMAILRQQEPFDFAGRTGHMHIDVDLKSSARRYVRFTFSPELTKTSVDDRGGYPKPSNALDI